MSISRSFQVYCSRCHTGYKAGQLGTCHRCGGILQPRYPEAAIATLAEVKPGRGLDRYRATMPVSSSIPNLGEGDTPLIPSRAIGPALGLRNLIFKNEGLNPSGAFKDRTGALVAALALDAGAKGVLTASSGNASSAIAAYCAAAGLDCIVLMEPGNPPSKLRQTLAAGARVIPVEGIFSRGPEPVKELMLRVAQDTGLYLGFVWAPVNPYILEGIKSISYEIAFRLPGAPEMIIGPVGGGDMLAAQWRGWLELEQAGAVARRPRMVAVQSTGAAPLVKAVVEDLERVPTLSRATSRVSGINVPFSGDHALAAVRSSGGLALSVTDAEILTMQRRLAEEEGIWVEPAGAAPLAALPHLVGQGHLSEGERVVCVLSGAGFKDQELAARRASSVRELPSAPFDPPAIAGLIGENTSG